MRCSLDGNNAKTLAKAVQSLSKFGAELFIEATDDGLLLRSINATRSAVGSYTFKRQFFDRFSIVRGTDNFCKVTAKSCFNIFRNMRQVEQCEIKICTEEERFEVEIKCQYEQTKKVSISIIDEENITAAVSTEDTPNEICLSSKIYNEISSNFYALEEEITLEAHTDSLSVKNYIEGSRVNDKFMRSRLKFNANELEKYDITEPTTITFCLKEFRAYLAFAEALNECISLNFSKAGDPCILRLKKLDVIEGILIMSTLSPDDIEYLDGPNENSTLNNISLNRSVANKRKLKNADSNASNEPQTKRQNRASESMSSDNTVLFNFDEGFNVNSSTNHHNMDDIIPIEEDTPTHSVRNANFIEEPVINSRLSVEFYDTEEQAEPEIINASPKRNIVRTIFSRCFQNTYFPEEPTSSSEVFAPDSDPDE